MPAKKKAAKPKQHRRTPAEIVAEQLAGDLQRVLAELVDACKVRDAWCHKAIECETRAEIAEEKLRKLQTEATEARPSIPVKPAFASTREVQPAPTYGLPGDAPTTRFYKEFRG